MALLGVSASSLLKVLSDAFGRTTSGSLGVSSNGSAWSNVVGSWFANGSSQARSDDGTAISTVGGTHTKFATSSVDIPDGNGGVGLAFWVSSAGSYWAAYPTYSTSTVTVCGSVTAVGTSTAGCCSGTVTNANSFYTATCNNGSTVGGCGMNTTTKARAACAGNPGEPSCCNSGPNQVGQCYNCQLSSSSTQYNSTMNLSKSGSIVDSANYATSASSYTPAYSVAVSTSNGTITYSMYSGAGRTGTLYGSRSYDGSADMPATSMVGLFKGTSTANQGSLLANFYSSLI